MQGTRFFKIITASVIATWLVGCSTPGVKDSTSNTAETTSENNEEMVVETMPVVDPAVQAVIDSGQVSASSEEIAQMFNKDMYQFGFDSSQLDTEDYKALDVKAAYLQSSAGQDKLITIQGHTDERGTRTYNLALGERRANVVKDYLISKGVQADRIEVISFGFEKPLDPEHHDAAWSKNRRAMIIVN